MTDDGTEHSAAIRAAAKAFVAVALPVLAESRLFPRPLSDPFVAIGRDYFGGDMVSAEHAALDRAIVDAHPRFQAVSPLIDRSFPSALTYSFLEACVTRLSIAKDPWNVDVPEVEQSIDELVTAVLVDESEVACCRVVSHLTTFDGHRQQFGDIEVVPMVQEPAGHRREVRETIASVIAASGIAFRGNDMSDAWAPPESVLIVKAVARQPYDAAKLLSGSLEAFLLTAQLLHSGTAQSMYEVQGGTTMVREYRPALFTFPGDAGLMSRTQMVRRDVVLDEDDPERIGGLRALMRRAQPARPEMIVDSFSLAIHRYQRSYFANSPYDQVVDLMTALEAAMAGVTKTDVLLRLRTRCATLLAVDNDSAEAIFADVGKLYELRSTLVHGGEMKTDKLIRLLSSLAHAPADAPFGEAFGYAVDRLRDLVRRSILARVCLAAGEPQLWPLGSDPDVDATLTSDVLRIAWRSAWHATLDGIGAFAAASRPRPAQSYLATFSKGT